MVYRTFPASRCSFLWYSAGGRKGDSLVCAPRHANVTERTTNDDKDGLSIMMMTIVTMMMMMMMMIDRGLMKRKIQFLMFPRTFFRLFRLIIHKGNSTRGKNMNLEQNSRDSRHFKYLSPDSECSRIPRSLPLYSGP